KAFVRRAPGGAPIAEHALLPPGLADRKGLPTQSLVELVVPPASLMTTLGALDRSAPHHVKWALERAELDFDRDIVPLLTGSITVAITREADPSAKPSSILALGLRDEAKAKALLEASLAKPRVAELGADVQRDGSGTVLVNKGNFFSFGADVAIRIE